MTRLLRFIRGRFLLHHKKVSYTIPMRELDWRQRRQKLCSANTQISAKAVSRVTDHIIFGSFGRFARLPPIGDLGSTRRKKATVSPAESISYFGETKVKLCMENWAHGFVETMSLAEPAS